MVRFLLSVYSAGLGVISSGCAPVPEMSLLDDFSDDGISLARQFQRGKRPFLPSASVLQAWGRTCRLGNMSEFLPSDSVHSTKRFELEMTISLALPSPLSDQPVSYAHLQPHPTLGELVQLVPGGSSIWLLTLGQVVRSPQGRPIWRAPWVQ